MVELFTSHDEEYGKACIPRYETNRSQYSPELLTGCPENTWYRGDQKRRRKEFFTEVTEYTGRELNPGLARGRGVCYHYTTGVVVSESAQMNSKRAEIVS